VQILKQGDIVTLSFDPQTGHEQKGRRPALVISNRTFHQFTKNMAFVCPITNTNRDLPTQIALDDRTKTSGVVMCDQAKILDMSKRNAVFVEEAPREIVLDAIDIVIGFIETEESE
jgi:mRNA interferase MazF